MENKIRNTLNEIYFGKTKDIVNGLRSVQPLAEANKMKDLQVIIRFKSISLSYSKNFIYCSRTEDLNHKQGRLGLKGLTFINTTFK